jgi:hypothetical protein
VKVKRRARASSAAAAGSTFLLFSIGAIGSKAPRWLFCLVDVKINTV